MCFSKQDTVHANAEHFNEDCEVFDISPEDLEINIPQCAWDLAAPNIAQNDAATNWQGFSTVQELTEETLHLQHILGHDSNKTGMLTHYQSYILKLPRSRLWIFRTIASR